MPLLSTDAAYLEDRGLQYAVTEESGMTCVVFPKFRLPPGLDHDSADLLIRLPAGYPDLPPDMWWLDPAIRTRDGAAIVATESIETHLGRTWQRWSRHFQPGQWQSGVDGLESYMALINRELAKSVPRGS